MVSNANDDLPEPESPVNTMSLSRGSSSEMLRRLCSRAPRIVMVSATVKAYRRPATRTRVCSAVLFGSGRVLEHDHLQWSAELADDVPSIELPQIRLEVARHQHHLV